MESAVLLLFLGAISALRNVSWVVPVWVLLRSGKSSSCCVGAGCGNGGQRQIWHGCGFRANAKILRAIVSQRSELKGL
jgi:hypothetical protein